MRSFRNSTKHDLTRDTSSSRSVLPASSYGDDGDSSADGMPKNAEKSLNYLLELFSHLPHVEKLQVIATKFQPSSKDKFGPKGYMVAFKNYTELVSLVNGIAANYIGEKKPVLTSDSVAVRYDGLPSEGRLSYLEVSDTLVAESLSLIHI